ncbi:DUF3040 domain-containing protein [Fodinicola acaciae]|uniref:DUF3040 domain-containing protein n=1 Tax=Fodinicola acaciae TaxID=2681555 RepID=UPI0013D41CCC|nr:DUF3040 domain-containing protein [Fodinicola acaciae]
MSSLYDWRRLREIERDLQQSDPVWVARFHRMAARSDVAWHGRTEIRIMLLGLALLVTLFGGIAGNLFFVILGLAGAAAVGALWVADRRRRREPF